VGALRYGLLTIAGAGRDAPVGMRRGRGKTVCARGATLALVPGRSASPLEGRFGRRAGRELVVLPGHPF